MPGYIQEEPKQWIVLRTLYPDKDNNLRKIRSGKLLAQACHSSMMFLLRHLQGEQMSEEQNKWIDGDITKVCLYVNTEEDLLTYYNKLLDSGIPVYLIKDKGLTEFNNQPTVTCFSVGPDLPSKVNPILGHLPLY